MSLFYRLGSPVSSSGVSEIDVLGVVYPSVQTFVDDNGVAFVEHLGVSPTKYRFSLWDMLGELRLVHRMLPPSNMIPTLNPARYLSDAITNLSDDDEHLRVLLSDFIGEYSSVLESVAGSSFCHGDLTLRSLVVNDFGVSHLVGWGSSCVASKYLDYASVWFDMCSEGGMPGVRPENLSDTPFESDIFVACLLFVMIRAVVGVLASGRAVSPVVEDVRLACKGFENESALSDFVKLCAKM